MNGALYTRDGDLFVPGDLTVGPWYADAQHGGPVAALLARAVESVESPVPVQTVRLTVELLRPVPLKPVSLGAELVRPGKRVQLVESTLSVDGSVVARARGLRIRVEAVEVPSQEPFPPSPALPVGDRVARVGPVRTAFADAMDLRFVRGGWEELGPVTMWSRLVVDVVEGEDASPLQRTAAAADFGNGVSRILDFETHMFVNPDLTVALSRVPVGEWIGFDAVSRVSGEGYGQAEALIFDAEGPVGRSVQSLYVSTR